MYCVSVEVTISIAQRAKVFPVEYPKLLYPSGSSLIKRGARPQNKLTRSRIARFFRASTCARLQRSTLDEDTYSTSSLTHPHLTFLSLNQIPFAESVVTFRCASPTIPTPISKEVSPFRDALLISITSGSASHCRSTTAEAAPGDCTGMVQQSQVLHPRGDHLAYQYGRIEGRC